ncbi:anhydro-N-acetylmuramic acid kinase [Alteromonas sp. a30]|uniref:anhydro-N-acetylmuramic acid kinase n=1 Tax=Alteromonas sp. a30 TaxID=2730917 RepID=UPI00227DBE43|nr:anhydro-N-acetylmuramic acid kinase [Alteromonas sp. a30]MCY7294506.1 anhydro-N-acetylmuramic acid kinase [Alteromonas sp. a30]
MSSSQLYIGLMSGTSVDGIDVALLDMHLGNSKLVDCFTHPYPPALATTLHSLCEPDHNEIVNLGEADIAVALAFSDAVFAMLKKHGLSAQDIQAIGSHGQTVRHHPELSHPFTLQIGDANTLATITDIDVVADFRRKDIALGGQGAPLVPAFHQAVFSSRTDDSNAIKNAQNRAIVNIGGIANITWLPASPQQPVLGFDTGPGNVLMDAWCKQHKNFSFDENGMWANQGRVDEDLLTALMSHPYLSQPYPKSTGREIFNLTWLNQILASKRNYQVIDPVDVQRTLLAFTAESICLHLNQLEGLEEVYICGGGARNTALMQVLQSACNTIPVYSTEALGIHPDSVEAAAFAWLAYAHIHRIAGNMPSVTGARRSAVLGGFYPAA